MQIKFVTGNIGKVRELQKVLRANISQLTLQLPEVQALDVDDVIRFKAEQAFQQFKTLVLVEDTGLSFAAWNGLPGALIKWFLSSVNSAGICQMMKDELNRNVTAKCTFDLYDGKEHYLFSGELQGTLANEPRGSGGFGWDDIFIPEGYVQTFAEMAEEEKYGISMRRAAIDKLKAFLDG